MIDNEGTFKKYLEDIKNAARENGLIPIWGTEIEKRWFPITIVELVYRRSTKDAQKRVRILQLKYSEHKFSLKMAYN